MDGRGASSYIDAVVLRQKDDNSGWTSAADGVLEQRYYYCQNWRADVSAIVNGSGKMREWVKYSSYGIPFGLPAGDTDSDGDCDQTDINNIDNWVSAYDVRYDLDLDGDIDATDSSRASTTFQGTTLGWGVLTNSAVGNRKGYAGYEWDEAVSKYHVRNRILDPALGRWTRRDPLGYVDGKNLNQFALGQPLSRHDFLGLAVARCCGWNVPDGFGDEIIPIPGQSGEDRCCCLYALAQGFDSQWGTIDWGGVMCCNGRMIGCSWYPKDGMNCNPPGGRRGCDFGDQIIAKCIGEHEKNHFPASTCDNVITPCSRSPWKPNVAAPKREFTAYCKELQCIMRQGRKCRKLTGDDRDACLHKMACDRRRICYYMQQNGHMRDCAGAKKGGCDNLPTLDECRG